eukprot:8974746-Pyramimonas_sp.AAC.1
MVQGGLNGLGGIPAPRTSTMIMLLEMMPATMPAMMRMLWALGGTDADDTSDACYLLPHLSLLLL